jgi:integrase
MLNTDDTLGTYSSLRSQVLASLPSPHSRRVYGKALDDVDKWFGVNQKIDNFNKANIQSYLTSLEKRGLAPSSINVQLCAIRKLAAIIFNLGNLDPRHAAAIADIASVRGVRLPSTRTANWLTLSEAKKMLALPDRRSNRGQRDRAVLYLLIGCGLRCGELVQLDVENIQQIDDRWVLSLAGKYKRTVPMPAKTKEAIDRWMASAGFSSGRLLRAVHKSGHIVGEGITTQCVSEIVRRYGSQIGRRLGPHDLRRTFAKLAYDGKAPVEQIRILLSHASIQTTERNLGIEQDLTDYSCYRLGI